MHSHFTFFNDLYIIKQQDPQHLSTATCDVSHGEHFIVDRFSNRNFVIPVMLF